MLARVSKIIAPARRRPTVLGGPPSSGSNHSHGNSFFENLNFPSSDSAPLPAVPGTEGTVCLLLFDAPLCLRHVTVVLRYSRLGYSRISVIVGVFCSDKRTLREEHCYGYSQVSLVVWFLERRKEPTITRDYCTIRWSVL
jgi:hypothetical protein